MSPPAPPARSTAGASGQFHPGEAGRPRTAAFPQLGKASAGPSRERARRQNSMRSGLDQFSGPAVRPGTGLRPPRLSYFGVSVTGATTALSFSPPNSPQDGRSNGPPDWLQPAIASRLATAKLCAMVLRDNFWFQASCDTFEVSIAGVCNMTTTPH